MAPVNPVRHGVALHGTAWCPTAQLLTLTFLTLTCFKHQEGSSADFRLDLRLEHLEFCVAAWVQPFHLTLGPGKTLPESGLGLRTCQAAVATHILPCHADPHSDARGLTATAPATARLEKELSEFRWRKGLGTALQFLLTY